LATTFTAVEYSYEEVVIWEEKNQPVYPDHPYIENVLYIDKHPQPSHSPCLPSLLQTYYGSLDAQTAIQYITSQFQTGDMPYMISRINLCTYQMPAQCQMWCLPTIGPSSAWTWPGYLLNAKLAVFAVP